jgi:uncharacterized protein
MKLLRALIFISIITLTLFFANLFVTNRLFEYFGINLYLLSLTAFLFPVGIILDKVKQNKFTSTLYAYVWILGGVTLISWTTFITIELLSFLINISTLTKGYVASLAAFFLILISLISAERITVREFNLKLNVKKKITLVQVTDIHLGTIHKEKFLSKVVNKINSLNPDYTFIIGDLFDGSGSVTKNMLKPFKELKIKPYFTTGNHENYVGLQNVLPKLNKLFIILRNEIVETKDLQIIGLDNPEKEVLKNLKIMEDLGSKINQKKPSILLLHTPTAINSFKKTKINLMLSGHTHAGQIFPLNFVVKYVHKYVYGLYKFDNQYLNISSGVGTAGPHMRLFTKSEIVKINLLPNNS